jgi:putative inorganic carbon (hco3(-)) transporter
MIGLAVTNAIPQNVAPAKGLLSLLVLGYVVLLPYLFNVGDRINFALADIFLLLVIVLAAGRLRFRPDLWSAWHAAIPVTFALGSLVGALHWGALDRYELFNKDAGLLLPFLSYFAVTSSITDWPDLRRVIRYFTLGVVFENTVAIGGFLAAYFWGVATPFTRYEGVRLSGMLLDPNAYGGLLAVALVLLEGASWGPAPLFRGVTLWFSRVTLALGVLFTFSRSAWIGLTLAVVIFFVVKPRVAIRPLLSAVVLSPCLFLVLGDRFLPFLENMARRPQQVQQRIDLIRDAIGAFLNHPVVGGGLGSFRLAVGEVAHNTALWFLADFGLLGLAVLLLFMAWFVRRAWLSYQFATREHRPLALALLLAHAAMIGVAMGIEAFYQRHWWLVMALIAACYSLTRRQPVNWTPSNQLARVHG